MQLAQADLLGVDGEARLVGERVVVVEGLDQLGAGQAQRAQPGVGRLSRARDRQGPRVAALEEDRLVAALPAVVGREHVIDQRDVVDGARIAGREGREIGTPRDQLLQRRSLARGEAVQQGEQLDEVGLRAADLRPPGRGGGAQHLERVGAGQRDALSGRVEDPLRPVGSQLRLEQRGEVLAPQLDDRVRRAEPVREQGDRRRVAIRQQRDAPGALEGLEGEPRGIVEGSILEVTAQARIGEIDRGVGLEQGAHELRLIEVLVADAQPQRRAGEGRLGGLLEEGGVGIEGIVSVPGDPVGDGLGGVGLDVRAPPRVIEARQAREPLLVREHVGQQRGDQGRAAVGEIAQLADLLQLVHVRVGQILLAIQRLPQIGAGRVARLGDLHRRGVSGLGRGDLREIERGRQGQPAAPLGGLSEQVLVPQRLEILAGGLEGARDLGADAVVRDLLRDGVAVHLGAAGEQPHRIGGEAGPDQGVDQLLVEIGLVADALSGDQRGGRLDVDARSPRRDGEGDPLELIEILIGLLHHLLEAPAEDLELGGDRPVGIGHHDLDPVVRGGAQVHRGARDALLLPIQDLDLQIDGHAGFLSVLDREGARVGGAHLAELALFEDVALDGPDLHPGQGRAADVGHLAADPGDAGGQRVGGALALLQRAPILQDLVEPHGGVAIDRARRGQPVGHLEAAEGTLGRGAEGATVDVGLGDPDPDLFEGSMEIGDALAVGAGFEGVGDRSHLCSGPPGTASGGDRAPTEHTSSVCSRCNLASGRISAGPEIARHDRLRSRRRRSTLRGSTRSRPRRRSGGTPRSARSLRPPGCWRRGRPRCRSPRAARAGPRAPARPPARSPAAACARCCRAAGHRGCRSALPGTPAPAGWRAGPSPTARTDRSGGSRASW